MTDAVGRDAGVVSSAVAATRRRGLALCLSGGGYRATLFHLGAVRRLHELGILARVDTISSVSGGSLFAGILADIAIDRGWSRGLAVEHFDRDVAERVRMLARRDLRTGPFLAHVGWNWLLPGPRARHFERLVTKHVSRRALSELPDRPRFVFCATDVSFGVNWESSRERTGSWRAGYLVNGAEWPIGRAVAASACFPPVFGPLPVRAPVDAFRRGRVPGQLGDRLRSRLSLSDGGVYDNMGLEPVWKDHACVLISDCGAPFEFAACRNPLGRLTRYTSVVMNQARSLRSRMFFAGITSGAHTGAYWSIDTPSEGQGYPQDLIRDCIAEIRTDLDAFTDAEQRILENHGYWVADARVRARLPDLPTPDAPPPSAPSPEWMDPRRVSQALRGSDRRISPNRILTRRRPDQPLSGQTVNPVRE
jgi:NTE family protein